MAFNTSASFEKASNFGSDGSDYSDHFEYLSSDESTLPSTPPSPVWLRNEEEERIEATERDRVDPPQLKMVIPMNGAGMQQEGETPAVVKDRFAKFWWLLMGFYIAVCVGRLVATDIFGGLLSGIMAVIAWYMVTNDCAKMSQYCILMFGFVCTMNGVLEFVTLVSSLNGRQTSRSQSAPLPQTGASSHATSTSWTITVEKHPFFDGDAGFLYNQQSAMMIVCPLAAFIGAAIAYSTYNAFPTSLFDESGAEAQNLGGSGFGGGMYGGGGGVEGGGGGGNGGGRAFQSGSQQAPSLWAGQGQRLGSA